jgi:hypothetical protein
VVDVGSWLDAYRRAWEDAETAAALFDDQATYRSNIFQEPYDGSDGVRRYWQEVTASQSQVSARMGRPFVDGNRVAAEFWTTMLVDGAETTLPGCLLLEFGDDGRCRSLREYWHFEGGLLEPPPEWGKRELGATPAGSVLSKAWKRTARTSPRTRESVSACARSSSA